MTGNGNVFLADAQRFSTGHAQLLLDDVDPCHHFCYRVFDLNPGVHLNEVETFVFIKKLQGAGAAILHVFAGLNTGVGDVCSDIIRNARRWRFFDDLLVAPL